MHPPSLLSQYTAINKSSENEFNEQLLPIEEISNEGLLDGKTPRRDFLKYLGFSTAAAAIAASCEMPERLFLLLLLMTNRFLLF